MGQGLEGHTDDSDFMPGTNGSHESILRVGAAIWLTSCEDLYCCPFVNKDHTDGKVILGQPL